MHGWELGKGGGWRRMGVAQGVIHAWTAQALGDACLWFKQGTRAMHGCLQACISFLTYLMTIGEVARAFGEAFEPYDTLYTSVSSCMHVLRIA